jgi:prepilin-type N-terminal cleavage/methylation domain-containing protein
MLLRARGVAGRNAKRSGMLGFSLIEVVVVLAILAVFSSVTWSVFSRFANGSLIDTQARLVYAVLSDARSRTLASKSDLQYGVHFATSSLVLFQGPSYDVAATTNATTTLSAKVSLATALSDGASDIVFEKITGEASAYGTSTVLLLASSTPVSAVSIVVYPTGVIEVVQ